MNRERNPLQKPVVPVTLAMQPTPTVPDPGAFTGYDDLGIAAILVFVIFLILGVVFGLGVMFYRRVIVWGSTVDLLIDNADRRATIKEQEAEEWKASCRRIAEDANANLERALTMRDEVTRLRGLGPEKDNP